MAATQPKKSGRGGKLKKQPPPPRQALPVRITGPLLDRVDDVRPELVPREPFIRHLIEIGLEEYEDE